MRYTNIHPGTIYANVLVADCVMHIRVTGRNCLASSGLWQKVILHPADLISDLSIQSPPMQLSEVPLGCLEIVSKRTSVLMKRSEEEGGHEFAASGARCGCLKHSTTKQSCAEQSRGEELPLGPAGCTPAGTHRDKRKPGPDELGRESAGLPGPPGQVPPRPPGDSGALEKGGKEGGRESFPNTLGSRGEHNALAGSAHLSPGESSTFLAPKLPPQLEGRQSGEVHVIQPQTRSSAHLVRLAAEGASSAGTSAERGAAVPPLTARDELPETVRGREKCTPSTQAPAQPPACVSAARLVPPRRLDKH